MEDISFLNTLKMKYNYSDKLMTALDKIIPKLIAFYGDEYEELIKKAISSTIIIECNSYQPLSVVIDGLNIVKENKEKSLIKENLKLAGGIYLADPVIVYDELLKNYIIKDVKRYIILSHFYNLDSPRGIATLTHELSKLIRSFHNEFRIDDDILTTRSGFKIEKKQIRKTDEGLELYLLSEENTGLELGVNSYEEECITSSVINDKYSSFDYNLPKKTAFILYERLGLKNEILLTSILGSDTLKDKYDVRPSLFEDLSLLLDQTLVLEEQNHNIDLTKGEKEQLKEQLININQEIGNNIIFFISASVILEDKKTIYN